MISDPNKRKWIYGVIIAALPILAALGILEESNVPLWVALAAAIFAPSLAIAHVGHSQADTAMDEDFDAESFQ